MTSTGQETARRRTFAIISHPDAGKTTLTEKLLLFGGAIQLAGTVKGRKAARHATSDWMALEKQRGISITSSVMQFPFRDRIINLLDTPGHEDFSEDTYRTLTAVDSALMVIDCAKGVEERTIKLMEVCRLRDTPIMTFINKLDREGRPPIELLDEVESVLEIRTAPQDRVEQLDRAGVFIGIDEVPLAAAVKPDAGRFLQRGRKCLIGDLLGPAVRQQRYRCHVGAGQEPRHPRPQGFPPRDRCRQDHDAGRWAAREHQEAVDDFLRHPAAANDHQ